MLSSRIKRIAVSVILIAAFVGLAFVYKKIVKLYLADHQVCLIKGESLE
jgi:hypothetical protein